MKCALASLGFVNSLCLDKASEHEIAKDGSCHFEKSKIIAEIKAGAEGVLVVEL